MKLKKNYLTSEELIFIINEMEKVETNIEREIIKVGLVYQMLVEDLEELEDCNAYYDAYVSQKEIWFESDVTNYCDIDMIVSKDLGTEKILKDFLVEISDKIDNVMKNINTQELLGQMKDLVENGKTRV